jgi:hypothetical protein
VGEIVAITQAADKPHSRLAYLVDEEMARRTGVVPAASNQVHVSF